MRIRSVIIADDRAEVSLTVNGHYDHWVYYQRDGNGWEERVSGNGPAIGWEDPSAIEW